MAPPPIIEPPRNIAAVSYEMSPAHRRFPYSTCEGVGLHQPESEHGLSLEVFGALTGDALPGLFLEVEEGLPAGWTEHDSLTSSADV